MSLPLHKNTPSPPAPRPPLRALATTSPRPVPVDAPGRVTEVEPHTLWPVRPAGLPQHRAFGVRPRPRPMAEHRPAARLRRAAFIHRLSVDAGRSCPAAAVDRPCVSTRRFRFSGADTRARPRRPSSVLCLCARWRFGAFAAPRQPGPGRCGASARRCPAPALSPGASEQPCPCASPCRFPAARPASRLRSRSRPPRLARPPPSALTSSTGPHPQPHSCSRLPTCPCRHLPSGPPVPSAPRSTLLRRAVAGGRCPVSFLLSFRFWSVGGFFCEEAPVSRAVAGG